MTCVDVGTANPDIAGLGIILSFTIQAGLSFFLSGWSTWIETRLRGREAHRIRKQRRDEHEGDGGRIDELFKGIFVENHIRLMLDRTPPDGDRKIEFIDRVLRTIGDTQLLNGISLLIGALAQHQTLGLYHFHIVYDVVNLTGVSAAAAVTTTFKRPDGFIFSSLLISAYTGLYLAFIILFGLKLQSWDDGSLGRCYNASGTSHPTAAHPLVDHIYLGVTAFYLFTSLGMCSYVAPETFRDAIRGLDQSLVAIIQTLDQMDQPGTRLLAGWITGIRQALEQCTSNKSVLQGAFAITQRRQIKTHHFFSDPIKRRRLENLLGFYHGKSKVSPYDARVTILAYALVQYPVHGYMVYALRASNEKFLSGSSENEWGFGQIVALTLVVATLLECFKAWAEYVVLREPDGADTANTGKSWRMSLLRTLLFGNDKVSSPVLLSNRPKGLRRRQSLPSDFKYA